MTHIKLRVAVLCLVALVMLTVLGNTALAQLFTPQPVPSCTLINLGGGMYSYNCPGQPPQIITVVK